MAARARKTADQAPLWPEGRHHRRGPNSRALGTAVQALRDAGLLERADEGLIVYVRTAAALVDAALVDREESRFTLARLLGEYAAGLDRLRQLAPQADDDVNELLRALSAPMGDGPDA